MSMNFSPTRRDVMKGVAATAMTAASYRRVAGANSRIGVALIGVGRRGREVGAGLLGDPRAELLAICDIYDVQRTRAVAALKTSDSVKQLVAHEEALALAGVDAVVIAAPDHLHATLATAALAARKHVYLEKPTIHKWQERTQIAEALQRSGTVLQCGTQQRSGAHYWRAKREIFETKRLGKVLYARCVWHNFPWQRREIPPGPKPASLDWERFLGPAPHIPYEAVRYDSWRYFPEYGAGLLADILTHWADVAQWMLDDAAPQSAVAQGGIYVLKDGRRNPDTTSALIEYRDWNLSFESSVLSIRNDHPSVLFEGTEGLLDISREGYTFTPRSGQPDTVNSTENLERAHTKNFLDSITGSAKPNASFDVGISATRPVQMALEAYRTGRRITAAEIDSLTSGEKVKSTGRLRSRFGTDVSC
jgi:predicted dehydrogenase